MSKVSIDVGHSKEDGGAINKAFNVNEFGFNSELAPLIKHELEVLNIECEIVFRKSYSQLPLQINATGADVSVSLHCNACNGIASGTEVLYWHTSSNGKRLANNIQNEMLDVLGLRDRGIKPLDNGDRGASSLRKTVMPAVIVESGFIDNNVDYLILQDNKEKLAKAIATGIKNYLNKLS